MKRKGIPKKRIGPAPGCWERSIRKRQFKGAVITLNAAERSIYSDGDMSASLCGIKEEKKEKKYEKEVMLRVSSMIGRDVILNEVKDLIKDLLGFFAFDSE